MIVESQFKPARWLAGAHLQTVWPTLFRRIPSNTLTRERVELPDDDFIDLDWTPPQDGPLILILHGLEGCSQSAYAAGLLNALHHNGMQGVLMHFRGCSGEPNRQLHSYHAGETGDMAFIVNQLKARFPDRKFAAVGFSLGGNALLKWLGESNAENPLACAAAVSVPFDLDACARRLENGLSRAYLGYLLRKMVRSARRKIDWHNYPVDKAFLDSVKSIRIFDDKVTAPLHGFIGVDDYYQRSSSRNYLSDIHQPTLILQAKDDPFMTPSVLPDDHELSPHVRLELSAQGGHVGFIDETGNYWLEQRIIEWLNEQLN